MIIQIKHRDTGTVLYEGDHDTLRSAICEAVRNRADLYGANLSGADLGGARISWSSHALLSEILWRAAGDVESRLMLAAYVGRRVEWCWSQWEVWTHPDREWALAELAKWIHPDDGDGVPKIVREHAQVQP